MRISPLKIALRKNMPKAAMKEIIIVLIVVSSLLNKYTIKKYYYNIRKFFDI
jgi:hypothetical protein